MQNRQSALNEWLKIQFPHLHFTITPLTGDASFRRYFRLHQENHTRIVMDAPPDKESLSAFIHIGQALSTAGICTPQIFAADETLGFALLDDLGDLLFLNALPKSNPDILYRAAIQTLLKIQQCETTDLQLPVFDNNKLYEELCLFHDWFLQKYLNITLTSTEEQLITDTFNYLINHMLHQPQVFVHRDYHSRNIMIKDELKLAVIDFQDAVTGPFTYDLVSLLKDCYIQWPPEQLLNWLTYFYDNCPLKHNYTLDEFKQAFDICGLQRHLKVLGIFCRLHLRDNKSNYLNDLPLVFHYVMAYLESSDTLQDFYQLMRNKIQIAFLEK